MCFAIFQYFETKPALCCNSLRKTRGIGTRHALSLCWTVFKKISETNWRSLLRRGWLFQSQTFRIPTKIPETRIFLWEKALENDVGGSPLLQSETIPATNNSVPLVVVLGFQALFLTDAVFWIWSFLVSEMCWKVHCSSFPAICQLLHLAETLPCSLKTLYGIKGARNYRCGIVWGLGHRNGDLRLPRIFPTDLRSPVKNSWGGGGGVSTYLLRNERVSLEKMCGEFKSSLHIVWERAVVMPPPRQFLGPQRSWCILACHHFVAGDICPNLWCHLTKNHSRRMKFHASKRLETRQNKKAPRGTEMSHVGNRNSWKTRNNFHENRSICQWKAVSNWETKVIIVWEAGDLHPVVRMWRSAWDRLGQWCISDSKLRLMKSAHQVLELWCRGVSVDSWLAVGFHYSHDLGLKTVWEMRICVSAPKTKQRKKEKHNTNLHICITFVVFLVVFAQRLFHSVLNRVPKQDKRDVGEAGSSFDNDWNTGAISMPWIFNAPQTLCTKPGSTRLWWKKLLQFLIIVCLNRIAGWEAGWVSVLLNAGFYRNHPFRTGTLSNLQLPWNVAKVSAVSQTFCSLIITVSYQRKQGREAICACTHLITALH